MADELKESPYSATNTGRGLLITGAGVALVAISDLWLLPRRALAFLYLFPIILGGGFLPRWQAAGMAIACAVLASLGAPVSWEGSLSPLTVILFSTFIVAGLFASQMGSNRRRLEAQLLELDRQIRLRQEAEEELKVLIDSSAAAILTVGPQGRILQANRAAEVIFGAEPRQLNGEPIEVYLPFLAPVVRHMDRATVFRTTIDGRGRRRGGEGFFAQVSFSTYETSSGRRLAAIVWDASEQVREREELGLRQLISSSRILMGAISHEVRNLCSAIAMVHLNLSRVPELAANSDFQALGNLVTALERLAAAELQSLHRGQIHGTDLAALLEELQIIVRSQFRDSGTRLRWEVSDAFPAVRADRSGLLQVLLNLLNNSHREVQRLDEGEKVVELVAYPMSDCVVVRVSNYGPPTELQSELFQPLTAGASATGLGLYVSRAIVRTFGGELRYGRDGNKHSFLVELMRADRADPAPPAQSA
jgi:PAS domain S-box-containing protein